MANQGTNSQRALHTDQSGEQLNHYETLKYLPEQQILAGDEVPAQADGSNAVGGGDQQAYQ